MCTELLPIGGVASYRRLHFGRVLQPGNPTLGGHHVYVVLSLENTQTLRVLNRRDPIAQAHACHSVNLGEGSGHDDARIIRWLIKEGGVLRRLYSEVMIGLVDEDITGCGQIVHESVEPLARRQTGSGIVRIADIDK